MFAVRYICLILVCISWPVTEAPDPSGHILAPILSEYLGRVFEVLRTKAECLTFITDCAMIIDDYPTYSCTYESRTFARLQRVPCLYHPVVRCVRSHQNSTYSSIWQ
jgi:hypothetical protein